ncbi:MAG: RES family NAD+ phosphorylase [Deinococcota bacterium]|nr:RES family NAD+ phosphorylase [Deinococcota bacterium]
MITAYRLSHEIALQANPDPFKPGTSENRWNSAGVQIAYAGESLAITALELLTYWGRYSSMRGYRFFTITFEPSDVEDAQQRQPSIDVHDKSQTRRYGDAWAEERRSLVLRVPSVVLPMSFNYLVNPNHSRYDPTKATAHGAFEYNERIGHLIDKAKSG